MSLLRITRSGDVLLRALPEKSQNRADRDLSVAMLCRDDKNREICHVERI